MKKSLSFSDIKPFIRYAQRVTVTDESSLGSLRAYDNRFFFCVGGSGYIDVEGCRYTMHRGCVLLWQAGKKYDIVCDRDKELSLLGIDFDYTQKNRLLSTPLPSGGNDFDKKSILESVTFSDAPCLNDVLYLNNMQLLENNIALICDEYMRRLSFYDTRISALFTSVLAEMLREHTLEDDNIRRSKSKVEEILIYISEHYNEELTNSALGRRFSYHPNYINHLVAQHTGMSLHRYVLTYRINRAIELLRTTELPVSVISEQVGFYDYNHFLKYFKRVTGYTTRAFREK